MSTRRLQHTCQQSSTSLRWSTRPPQHSPKRSTLPSLHEAYVALSLCLFVALLPPLFGLLSHFPGRTIQTIQYRPYNISQPQHIIAGQQLLLVSGIHCASDFERASARERESERARGRAFFASRSARHARHLNRRTLAYLWGFRV